MNTHPAPRGGQMSAQTSTDEDEALFLRCVETINQEGMASTSLLQRRLTLGFVRAMRMMQMLEDRGYIGPIREDKPAAPREILKREVSATQDAAQAGAAEILRACAECTHDERDHGICLNCGMDCDMNSHHFREVLVNGSFVKVTLAKDRSRTPETDAFVSRASCKNGKTVTDDFTKKELTEFARTLETRLLAAEQQRDEARRCAEGYMQNANPTACGACAEGICCGSTMHEHEPGCIVSRLTASQQREAELAGALRGVIAQNGNLPIESLDGKTGPNEGRQRGIMMRNAIEIARAALQAHTDTTK